MSVSNNKLQKSIWDKTIRKSSARISKSSKTEPSAPQITVNFTSSVILLFQFRSQRIKKKTEKKLSLFRVEPQCLAWTHTAGARGISHKHNGLVWLTVHIHVSDSHVSLPVWVHVFLFALSGFQFKIAEIQTNNLNQGSSAFFFLSGQGPLSC